MYYLIVFFVLSNFGQATAQQRQSNISRRSSLTPTKTSSWPSDSGLYAFGFYKRGNGYGVGVFIAGIPEKTVAWTAHRDNPPVSSNTTLLFTAEGKLILQEQGQQDVVVADFSQSASYASMLDTGNFVLYDSNGSVIWQSFGAPTDILRPTQRLSAGMDLFSSVAETDQSTGIFRLAMQRDGNLVQYPKEAPEQTAQYSYWSSGTDGKGDNVTLIFDEDGKLYLVDATGLNIKNITVESYATRGTVNLMRIDSDGVFRVYSHNLTHSSSWSILWNSATDRCAPKGLCGLNSFCFLKALGPVCDCLPGFARLNQDKHRTSGCKRNFTAESCKNKDQNYTLRELKNTIWEDNSYSVLSQTSQEDCEQACLDDCNCEAATFDNGECKKQRLPMRFGRMGEGSAIVLIKVEEMTESPHTDGILLAKSGKKEISIGTVIIISCLLSCLLIVIAAILGIILH